MFAILTEGNNVKIYKNLQEFKVFNTGFQIEGIFGGKLLAVKSADFISFYDWETQIAVRRIDVTPAPKQVYWSDDGKTVVMALEEQFYLLNYDAAQVKEYIS